MRGWLQRGRELLRKRMNRRGLAIPAALGTFFGIPTPVSATTSTTTINAALALPAVKPALLTPLLSSVASKLVMAALLFAAVFIAWRIYHAVPVPTPIAKPVLTSPNVGKWELTSDTPLPKGAIARIGDGRFTLELGTKQIRFADAGRRLVAVGKTEFIAWDVVTGKQIHRTSIEDERGDLSPDGKWFVQLGNVYDALTGKLVWKAFQDDRPDLVRFVSKNQVAATFYRAKPREVLVRLLDVEAKTVTEAAFAGFRAKPFPGGGLIAVWDRPKDNYHAILPDDNTERNIRVHDFANPSSKPVVLEGFRGEPLSVETEAAGKRLFAVTPDGQLSCWNTVTGERIYNAKVSIPTANEYRGMPDGSTIKYINESNLTPLAVSPKGDKVIWLNWNSTPDEYVCHSVEGKKMIWSFRPSSPGKPRFLFDETSDRLIFNDYTIKILSLDSGDLLSPKESKYAVRGPSYESQTMALSDDRRLIAFSNNNICLYDIEEILAPDASPLDSPDTIWREDRVSSVGFVPGCSNLVWAKNSQLMVYDVDARKKLDSMDIINGDSFVLDRFAGPKWVNFDPWNLKRTSFSWEGTRLRKVERSTSGLLKDAFRNGESTKGIVYLHEDCVYVGEIEAGEKARAYVTCWDVTSGAKKWVYCIEPDPSFTPSNRTSSEGITVCGQYQPIRFIALPDKKTLFVLTNTRAILLDSRSGEELKVISSGITKESQIEFDNAEISDDGSLLAIGVCIDRNQRNELRFYRASDLEQAAKAINLGEFNADFRNPSANDIV
jgi:hypothetical protein